MNADAESRERLVCAVRVRIEGRVQGVWYRGWTVDEAGARGLRGWVRNRADGSVEALFVGDEPAVRDMVAACRKGPPHARVRHVEEFTASDDGTPAFRQLHTE